MRLPKLLADTEQEDPMPHLRARGRAASRIVVPAAIATMLLAACSGADSTGPSAGTSASPRPAGMANGVCTEPPELPADIPTFSAADLPDPADPGVYRATIETTCGDIEVEMDATDNPVTVGSFAFLAESGYWTDSPCHRLTTEGIFVLQCGDPTGTGRGGPGYSFEVESYPSDGRYPVGSLAMARRGDDVNSNGSQFFIVYDDSTLPVNDGGYTLFGRVVSGMDIVELIARQGVEGGGQQGMPAQRISIVNVQVNDEAVSE